MIRALLASLLLAGTAHAVGPDSDAERLLDGLPRGFVKPNVVVLPLLDQRPLVEATPGAPQPPPEAWTAFIAALDARDNLDLIGPDEAKKRLTAAVAYKRGLEEARRRAIRGQGEHREVRLQAAATTLASAVQEFTEIGHHLVDPREVAKAQQTRGLALLEKGDATPAYDAFREALLLDPGLRPRAGFDRPETLEVFESARAALVSTGVPPPTEMARPVRSFPGLGDAIYIRGRVVPARDGQPARLEIVFKVPAGLQEDAQALGADAVDDGNRLASRVWSCLPFGQAPQKPRARNYLYLDAGFVWFTWLEAPVELFSNFGAGLNVSWMVAPNFTLDAGVALTNSNRDREEDLRADVPTLRGRLGAGYTGSWGRLRAFTTVGFEVASPGEVIITSDPNCKLFPEGNVEDDICDRETRIDETGRAVHIGPALSAGLGLRLVEDLYVTLRAEGAEYIYRTRDNGLGRVVGGQLGLGWRFF